MRVIRIEPPTIAWQTARFRWKVTPATALYQRTSFELRFPDAVDLTRVSEALWWRIALICLHPQWALLRPCRVVIPVTLAPGERESWLRMCDAHVAALEANAGGTDTARAVDLVEAGPPLAALEPIADSGIVAACFSGGRDSITQAALLQELGEHPLLVTTTSPREGSVEHETARRAHVMEEITRRRGLEVVTVHSDLRSAWNNGFAAARYGVAVSETSDTFLFFAAALAVAAARGAPRIFLAAEAEVQETVRNAGTIAQYKHYMYSAVTHLALEAVLEPAGIRYSGLTYPLAQFQVQRLLAKRYPDLRDLQYSRAGSLPPTSRRAAAAPNARRSVSTCWPAGSRRPRWESICRRCSAPQPTGARAARAHSPESPGPTRVGGWKRRSCAASTASRPNAWPSSSPTATLCAPTTRCAPRRWTAR